MEKKTNIKHCACKVKHCKVCNEKCIEYLVAKKLIDNKFEKIDGVGYVQF